MMVSCLRRGLEKMTKNDDMEGVLRELAEEAMITGGAVWTFGPDGSEQLFPQVRRSRKR
jgi:hypothetical protein